MFTSFKRKAMQLTLAGALGLGCFGMAAAGAVVNAACNPSIAHADSWQKSSDKW